jgi:3-hydroxyisobutyrate dehydrogenase-like beta-hydroxyacid dehydrogenase
MVGGSNEGYARAQPLLRQFAREIFHVGPAGAGALAKLVNNQIFLCASVLIQEGFVLGAKAGMDSNDLMRILNASSAGLHTRRTGFVLNRDFQQAVFKLGIAHKDLSVALESAAALGVQMPLTRAAEELYARAVQRGYGDQVYSATLQVLEEQADTSVAALRRDGDSG